MLQTYGGDTYLFEYDDTLHEFYVEEIATGIRECFPLKPEDIYALSCITRELPVVNLEANADEFDEEVE